MKVTQEKLPESQIGLEIEIPPEMSKKTYDKVLGKLMKSANIPGFRRGKVPRQVLMQRLGSARIHATVIEELVQDGIEQAIKQEEIAAIGNYQLQSSLDELIAQFKPDHTLTFSASVDVTPTVTMAEYKALTIQVEEVAAESDRINTTLEEYRDRYSTLVPVEDRAAQWGDVAIADFEGLLTPDAGSDEEPAAFPGNSAQDFQIEMQADRFIPGFVDGIVGMKPEETKEIAVAFPDSYPQAELAGKPVVFTITLKELKTKELPELDDEFAQEVSNQEFSTLDALKASLEERFQKEVEDKLQQNKEKAILTELVQHIDVDLPMTLVNQEVNYMISQTAMRLSQQGIDVGKLLTEDMIKRMRVDSRPEAINRLKRTLALGEIAKQESLTVTEADIKVRMEEMLKEVPPAQQRDIDPDRLRQVVEEDLLKEKILAWLEANWTIEWVPEGSLSGDDDELLAAATDDEETEETAAADATVDVTAVDAEAIATEPEA